MVAPRSHAICAAVVLFACGGSEADPDAGSVDASAIDAVPVADAVPIPDAPPPPDSGPDAIHYDANDTDAIQPLPGAICQSAIPLQLDTLVLGDTTPLVDALTASCSPGTSVGQDAIYVTNPGATPVDITVTAAVDEMADPVHDVVLHARQDCGNNATELGCIDAGWGERLELLGVSGQLYIIVDATFQFGGEIAGPYTLSTSVRSIVPLGDACDPNGVTSRCESGARCVGTTCVADSPAVACAEAVDLTGQLPADLTTTTYAFAADHYEGSCAFDASASFPEHIYRIDLAVESDLDISTDFAETTFDTYLYLRADTCTGAETGCHDDVDPQAVNLKSHLELDNIPAGTYFLFVDGSSASPGTGAYRLSVAATPS
jgi:hypothetical protein